MNVHFSNKQIELRKKEFHREKNRLRFLSSVNSVCFLQNASSGKNNNTS